MNDSPERKNDPLSEAGRARRDRMLPLIQEAMREGVRRRRRRRSVAGMVVLLGAAILGWELVETGRVVRIDAPPDRLAEETGDRETPSNTEERLATDVVPKTEDAAWGDADWSTFDPAEAYASLVASGEPIMVTSTAAIPPEWLSQETSMELDVRTIGTRDLVTMLGRIGIEASVICSREKCVFVRSRSKDTPPTSL
jgi:hypothetical protein